MIKLTSIQAPNQDYIVAGIAGYLNAQPSVNAAAVLNIPWQEREHLLDEGVVQIGWICGLPYVRKAAQDPDRFELLAAPVMKGARYQQRPIYYSDVVVKESSRFRNFGDLRGASWAYNEPGSHSGCSLTRYHLATLNENETFFGSILEAGSHQAALDLVLTGQIDASAIDSTVLEQEIRVRPQISEQLRIVAILGPSPIPPLVISRQVPLKKRQRIRALILAMDREPNGRALLETAGIARFVAVSDRDYDPIREMELAGRHVELVQPSKTNQKAAQPIGRH